MKRSILQLFKKGDNNVIKIVMLGLGLAMGLVLIAKVYFEQSYENYIPDIDRVYRIREIYDKTTDNTHNEWNQTAGAVAPGIKAYSPAVKSATRFTWLTDKVALFDTKDNRYNCGAVIFADTSFFEIFPRKVLAGNVGDAMNISGHAIICKSLADRIGYNVIGETFKVMEREVVIDAVIEDFPENSTHRYVEMLMALPTIGKYMYDGSNRWVGNDRYLSFVRLYPKSDEEEFNKAVEKMCDENIDNEGLAKMGVKLTFGITPVKDIRRNDKSIQRMCSLLTLIAAVLIISALLNYVLITISAMVRKAKTIAVHKCYGASKWNIYRIFLSDAFVHLVLSLIIAVLLVFSFEHLVEGLIGVSIKGLIQGNCIIILLAVCLVVFLVGGFLPGSIYAKIPVATAFRDYRESSRKWKHILLFVQFATSTLFITLLLIVVLQYRKMLNSDLGYNYDNLLYLDIEGVSEEQKQSIQQEIERLPFVKKTSRADGLPFEGASGNNIYLPGDPKEYINIADMYSVSKGYFDMMEIKIIEGSNFSEDVLTSHEVMVSRSFSEKMQILAGWNDGVVGKQILVTEHTQNIEKDFYTICGVYEDYVIGTMIYEDDRPSIQFYNETKVTTMGKLMIKVDEITPSKIAEINAVFKQMHPKSNAEVVVYSEMLRDCYVEIRRFRDSVLVAGLVVLLITLIGLVGYSQDEISRRRSEVAIRKINGSSLGELLIMFLKGVMKVAVPAVIVGSTATYFVAVELLKQFPQKIVLSWTIFVACGLLTLIIISAVVLATIYKTANANPVDSLKQ